MTRMKFFDTSIKKMSKRTLAALIIVFTATTAAMGYYTYVEWIDYEAIYLCTLSGLFTVYCGWVLFLKWDR